MSRSIARTGKGSSLRLSGVEVRAKRHSRARERSARLNRAVLEAMENRVLLSGTWQNLSASGSAPPDGGAAMMVLSDGSILIQDGKNVSGAGGQSADMFKLSP